MKKLELCLYTTNGNTVRCGEGEEYQWGGYVRVCDKNGNELFYRDSHEWEESPEEVMGAIFVAALGLPVVKK